MNEETGTSVAERLLDLLECLSSAPLTVREISEKSGIPISTVHRLIRPLLSRKYLLRQGRGRYGLGLASVELSSRADLDAIIASATRPVITNLAKNCRRTAHLGVFRNNLVRYLVRIEAGYSHPPSREMTELEAYCTAIGKVLLAQLSPEQLYEYLAQGDFVSLTENTISQPGSLTTELKEVRNQGWAIDRGEMFPELRCLAAPIHDRTGRVIAAISVTDTCKNDKLDEVEEELLKLLPRINAAAEEISALMRF